MAAAAALGHVGLISEQLLTWAPCSLVKHVTLKICFLRSLTNNDLFHLNLSHPNCMSRHIATNRHGRSSFKFSDCSFSLTLDTNTSDVGTEARFARSNLYFSQSIRGGNHGGTDPATQCVPAPHWLVTAAPGTNLRLSPREVCGRSGHSGR